jgi:signal transduction histidine kinase/ActR/RegA family two-component response regulator
MAKMSFFIRNIAGKRWKNSINFKLLAIVLVGVISLATVFILISSIFIHSIFDSLYREKLSAPSRTLLAQYSHADISKYVDILKNRPTFAAEARQYMADKTRLDEIKSATPDGNYPPEYYTLLQQLESYIKEFSKLKDNKYYTINTSLIETRIATGVKNISIISDVGLNDQYAYIYNAYYLADAEVNRNDDFGTVDLKAYCPELETVYQTGEAVYVFGANQKGAEPGMSYSYSPVKDGYDQVVAVVRASQNLESIGNKLNYFLLLNIAITVIIAGIIIISMLFALRNMIIRPIERLTAVSREIAAGNVSVEIPRFDSGGEDEMSMLVHSYESMRITLENLIHENRELFESTINGNLNARGNAGAFEGLFAQLIDNTNDTLEVIVRYFDSIPAAFAILDEKYDIAFSNKNFAKRFSGFSERELYQNLLGESTDDVAQLKQQLAAVLQAGEYKALCWFDFGAERRCYSFVCNTVYHGAETNGAVVVILDNTELVLAKDAALSASKAKSEFLSRVSHELRTPLNAILGLAKLGLNDKILDESKARFETIVSSSTHLSNIINDVLEMSRMESGKTDIRIARLNIFTAVAECVDMVAPRAAENKVELVSQVDAQIPVALLGDEFRIKQIILNLLSNAVKFTENGKVSIEVKCTGTTESGSSLSFSVADTGIGMSEAFLSKIFLPFEQEDSFLSRRYVGTGLGLSISYNLVELMGGEIKVESQLGVGSRFTFSLFLEHAEDLPEAAISPDENEAAELSLTVRGKRILLVDDVEINRMIVCELLADSGMEIDEAADGKEAWDKFMQNPPYYYDCILMDIQMPNLDGYKATELIRQSGRADSDVPVVAMTANALTEDIEAARQAGMNDHLSKPIDFELCIEVIKKYCGFNRRRGENV